MRPAVREVPDRPRATARSHGRAAAARRPISRRTHRLTRAMPDAAGPGTEGGAPSGRDPRIDTPSSRTSMSPTAEPGDSLVDERPPVIAMRDDLLERGLDVQPRPGTGSRRRRPDVAVRDALEAHRGSTFVRDDRRRVPVDVPPGVRERRQARSTGGSGPVAARRRPGRGAGRPRSNSSWNRRPELRRR